MSSSKELVRIPNFFSFTPFKWQGINPNHSSIIKTTKEWVLSQGNLDEVKQRKIDDAKCELFGAATYPYVDLDMLYVLNDSVVIVLLLDEITDELDYEGVLAVKETTLNAMTGKTPNDHCLHANFMRDFTKRLTVASIGLDTVIERFLHSYALYLDGMATEAKHRETKEILSVEDYVIHRRENCSVRFYLIFIEIALRIDFPPELLEDPNFVRVNDLAIDLVAIINDVYSFSAEYSRGIEGNTIVAAFMNEKKCPIQEAMVYTEAYYKDTLLAFLTTRAHMKSYGPEVDDAIKKYLSAIEQFIWGSAEWSLDNYRYWDKGTTIRQTYTFELKRNQK
ncbi:terpenoid synthase [Pyrrhoderma noxium]|uniref:Terpene synthase n=1 Tax=Pyrrhoderma noxium TaxID=2282107 RepID=A0A286UK52_9AGAM|nr:terpenoid synthase [Pyrrhoderma noxium]